MAREKLADVFSWQTFGEPLSRAISFGIKRTVSDVEREINKTLAAFFFLPENPHKRSHIYFKQKNGKIFSAELTYSYASIPLSRYPVSQHRITAGNQILSVKRGAAFGKAFGPGFSRKIVQKEAIATYVQIRRTGGPKLVMGTMGYKGWLHTGQKGRFSSQIFERNQKKTWESGRRLPVHALYGPAITELLKTAEMKSAVDRILLKAALEKRISEYVTKS